VNQPSRNDPLLTKAEVAHLLKVSEKTVSRWSKDGKILPKPIYLTPEMQEGGRRPRWVPQEVWKSVRKMQKRRAADTE